MAFDASPAVSGCSLAAMGQIELEMLYSKYQLMGAIRGYFTDLGAPEQIEGCEIPVAFGLDLLAQLTLHKRASPEVLAGILRHHFEDEENPAQACLDMLKKACKEDLCDYDPISGRLVMRYDIADDDLNSRIATFQYPLPMIEPPRPVTNNRQTGYRTIKRSVILKNNHHDEDVCLDHLNRVNAQKLSLNMDVVAFIQNSWEGLDKKKEDETVAEFQARKKAFEKYDTVSRDVLSALDLHDGFWLTHAYDKRGRTYAQGYHVNYQGNDWNKACVEFADAEVLNAE